MAEKKFCSEHKKMVARVVESADKEKFWHRVTHNQFFFWGVTVMILALASWVAWTTTEIYAQKTNTAVEKQTSADTAKDIKEVKEQQKQTEVLRQQDVKDLKGQAQRLDEKRQQDKEDIMKMLIEIRKDLIKK